MQIINDLGKSESKEDKSALLLALEKKLQEWNVTLFGAARTAMSFAKRTQAESQVKGLSERVNIDVSDILSTLDKSLKGQWSKAVANKAEKKNKELLEI